MVGSRVHCVLSDVVREMVDRYLSVLGDLDERGIDMASLDWSQCSAVESIPSKVSGAWVFRGTRMPVAAIFENLKTSTIEEVLGNFRVTREQVQTVLDFAAKSCRAF